MNSSRTFFIVRGSPGDRVFPGSIAAVLLLGAFLSLIHGIPGWGPVPLQAQEAGSIRGRVVDSETQSPLTGVSVTIRGSELGSLTSGDGSYRIGGVAPGTYVVVFQLLGYGTGTRSDVIVAPGRSTEAHAELHVAPLGLEGLVVDAGFFPKSESQPASAFTLNAEEIRRKPGSAGDVSRVLLALPSTAQVMDDGNDLFVRGGSPLENAFFIDHIQVGNINHFPVEGSTGGPIGMVNLEFVDDVRLSAGGFSAAYGDRLSSVVEIDFREGNRDRVELGIEGSMSSFEVNAEGPMAGGTGSWLLSVRRSYLDLIVGAIGTGVAPSYQDVQGKATYDLDDSNRLSTLILFGKSEIGFTQPEAEDEGNIAFGDYSSRQGTVGFSWRRLWRSRGYSVVALSGSRETADDDWLRTASGDSLVQSTYTEETLRIRNVNRIRLGTRARLELGAELEVTGNEYDYVLGQSYDRLGNVYPRYQVRENLDNKRGGAFASLTLGSTARWDFTVGSRVDHYSLSGETHLSPRVSTSVAVGERTTLNGAAGVYRQRLPSFILAQSPAFRELPSPRATHLVLGADYLLTPSAQVTLEGYWKEYSDLPLEEEDPTLFILDQGTSQSGFWGYRTLVSSGKARAYGLELLLQKKLTRGFHGLVSASLFRSRYRGLDGQWRGRSNENRYLLNVLGGYHPSHAWELSGRWSIAGGAPYTPFDLDASTELNRRVLDPIRANAVRYPTYHSLNLRVARRFLFRGSALTTYLEVWNAYDRTNVAGYYWNEVEKAPDTRTQWGLLPLVGLEWKF